jgi:hypothetical protein
MTDRETRDYRPLATELKFLVSPDRADAIRAWARATLKADPFGNGPHGDHYTTTTLYTDTGARDVYRRHGSFGRSKYRVRRYDSTDIAFLERKMRTSNSLSKRRAPVPLGDVARLHAPISSLPGWTGEWFAHRLAARRLEPVCQVAYDRMARVLPSPHGLARLTVDSGLRARPANRFEFEAPDYSPVLRTTEILELKFVIALPSAFKALLAEFGLAPMKVSKYRLSAEALGLVPSAAATQEVA